MRPCLLVAVLKASFVAAAAVTPLENALTASEAELELLNEAFSVFQANYTLNPDLSLLLGNKTAGIPVPDTILALALGPDTGTGTGSFLRDPDSRFPQNKVYHLRSKKDMDSHPELMDDTNNVIHFEDSNSSVYFDKDEDTWFEYLMLEPVKETPQLQSFPYMIPVSACLDSRHGSGATISRGYSVGLNIKNSLSAGSTFSFMINVTSVAIGANLGVSVGTSFTYLGSMLCTIPAGHVGQMMIQPFYIEVPPSLKRRVLYKKLQGWLQGPDLDYFQSFKQVAVHKPHHVCMVDTDPSMLLCNRITV